MSTLGALPNGSLKFSGGPTSPDTAIGASTTTNLRVGQDVNELAAVWLVRFTLPLDVGDTGSNGDASSFEVDPWPSPLPFHCYRLWRWW